MHSRPGMLLLILLLASATFVLMALLPEGVARHLPLGTGNLIVIGAVAIGLIAAYLRSRYQLNRDLNRWERKNRGYCIHCGYDLRATPKRCPECGNWVEEV